MTAAVESVSPAMCRKALRRLTSRATPHRSAAMMPFMATPAAATIIMRRGSTATGALRRCTASTAMAERDGDQRGGVDEGGKHAGPLITEGAGVVGGARLEIDGRKAEQEGEKIGDVMAGLGEQRQRVRAQSGDEGDDDVGQRGRERKAQDKRGSPCVLARGGGVKMHRDSVTGVGYAGKRERATPSSKKRSMGTRQGTREQENREQGVANRE